MRAAIAKECNACVSISVLTWHEAKRPNEDHNIRVFKKMNTIMNTTIRKPQGTTRRRQRHLSDRVALEAAFDVRRRAAREVDHRARERLVERRERAAVATNAALADEQMGAKGDRGKVKMGDREAPTR